VISIPLFAQQKDSWTIALDKKNVHSGVELTIHQKPPIVNIHGANIKTGSVLEIRYNEAPTNIAWKRSFVFCDSSDKVLARADFDRSNGSFSIPTSRFIAQLRKEKNLRLCSEQNPQNADMMIRSKRIVICTLHLL
jgi:hypothetical protein